MRRIRDSRPDDPGEHPLEVLPHQVDLDYGSVPIDQDVGRDLGDPVGASVVAAPAPLMRVGQRTL